MALCPIGCASLPPLAGRSPSTVLTDTSGTQLGQAVAGGAAGKGAVAAHSGASGFRALGRPREAFAARVALARAAERSLDVQYYIWHGDTSGSLLFAEMWDAAERGVRVRLLLDDNNTRGLDEIIAALDAHALIEVRLFNPFASRGSRMLGYVADFDRLNRRMHNKSFTADNQVTIVGGRNVGDEYFAAGGGTVFQDLDVLAVGPVAAEAGSAFDRYWNSDSAYPADLLVGHAPAGGVEKVKSRFAGVRASADAVQYLEEVRATTLVGDIVARRLSLALAPVRLLCDAPGKALGATAAEDLLVAELTRELGSARREVDIVSPYFVPRAAGAAALTAAARRGIRVRVITNSLAATDVSAVHAGYAKRRMALLRGGVKIYELKPDAGGESAARPRPEGAQAPGGNPGGSSGGSSAASLHAKTFVVDRGSVFIGSFNFDPRSANINTEMGVLIESPAFAEEVAAALDAKAPADAYEVVLSPDGERLEWIERLPQGGERRHTTEPRTGFFKRLGVGFMSLLPIEGML